MGGWALRLVGLCGDLVLAWAMFKVMDENGILGNKVSTNNASNVALRCKN